MLGLERLADYDRVAPLAEAERTVALRRGARAGARLLRELLARARRRPRAEFFTGDYIDAPPAPGKRGGAFCSYAVPSAHPYVMLNYTSRPGDVLTMAHELGHGVHAVAGARPQGMFEFGTPLTVAETASIFGETIVLGRLLEQARRRLRAAGAARLLARRRGRRGLSPGGDEPLRGPRAHRSGASPASSRSTASRGLGRHPDRAARRLGRALRGLQLVVVLRARTSSPRPATSTPTPTATCWRCRSTAATSRRARTSSSPTSSCCAPAARCRPRSSARSSASTSPIPGFWNAGLDLIERQLERAEETAAAVSG